jgi:hypothetical protein
MLDTMNRTLLEQLAQPVEPPAVSIVCPLDTRRPGNTHDPIVIRRLRDRAIEALDRHDASAVIPRLDDALAAIDLRHPAAAIAVFASADVSRVVELDAPVEARVTVGDRFALGEVASVLSSSMRTRALLLSQGANRCVDVTGSHAAERRDFGFPVDVAPPTESDTPHRDFPLDEHERAEAAKFVFRAVEEALAELERHDERPLVLVGTERDLSFFDEIARRRPHLIGRIHGNYAHATPHQVGKLIQPVVENRIHEAQREACDQVREAIGTRGVSGIVDVWHAARGGRGHRLVVEAGYSAPMRVVDETLVGATQGEPGAFDAVAEAISEVIRHHGDVVVVAPETLPDLGRVALVTRYSD